MGHAGIMLSAVRHSWFDCHPVFGETDYVAGMAHLALESYN